MPHFRAVYPVLTCYGLIVARALWCRMHCAIRVRPFASPSALLQRLVLLCVADNAWFRSRKRCSRKCSVIILHSRRFNVSRHRRPGLNEGFQVVDDDMYAAHTYVPTGVNAGSTSTRFSGTPPLARYQLAYVSVFWLCHRIHVLTRVPVHPSCCPSHWLVSRIPIRLHLSLSAIFYPSTTFTEGASSRQHTYPSHPSTHPGGRW
ncbi:hypothetical protein C8J57DRAFT_693240 [Mycena rebaudengoi]|nr:hypothetical protein C8J57DRAFT_693240 [Mycena rebaudengoi]